MSASNSFETSLLSLIFTNVAIADIGDASGLQPSATAGNFYLALHTADPAEGGAQNANEATYTDYARVAIARTTGAWTVTSNAVTNDNVINFPACTGGTNTITHWSLGVASSGATVQLISGALTASLAVSNGITPSIAAGDLDITLD